MNVGGLWVTDLVGRGREGMGKGGKGADGKGGQGGVVEGHWRRNKGNGRKRK